jgi:hypothetical protein
MKIVGVILGSLLIIGVALFLLVVQPGTSGVAASLRLPDGSEYMVTQRCNWSAEPYTVEFFMRSPGSPWGWCYIDHEANRWRAVAMTYDSASDTDRCHRAGHSSRRSQPHPKRLLDRQRQYSPRVSRTAGLSRAGFCLPVSRHNQFGRTAPNEAGSLGVGVSPPLV